MSEWWPQAAKTRKAEVLAAMPHVQEIPDRVEEMVGLTNAIHNTDCINLNPATNTMNPRAENLLSSGIGVRPSLGYPGAKYEMGLAGVEEIEIIAAELACRVFDAAYAEIRVPSGAMANLFTFMATCSPGDAVIVPPASIGGHVTHNTAGCAGLYGLEIHEAPIDPETYTVDPIGVAKLAEQVQPELITLGQSLNLVPHPIADLREIAESVGARLLFDAAHACAMFAGHQWPNPLTEGAHIMTMSTYESLGGPPGGLIVTNDADLAERVDTIAYPGMTANFDAAKTAALAVTLTDWLRTGTDYAAAMALTAHGLAECLTAANVPVFETVHGYTKSHQFAIDARAFGGGHATAVRLEKANILSSAIGLPSGEDDGLRVGTPEIVRWGMSHTDMPELATYLAQALFSEPTSIAPRITQMRQRFKTLAYVS
ncbi:MAG: serine hydroxymethyltransferase [Acidimicrobiales bacterium]|nr:serine hydroxymethyltransferase [Acidimicrobiales bacterium]